jgi:Ca2+-transporting ATPase
MGAFIGVMGFVMSLIVLSVGIWAYRSGDAAWQTLLFTTLIFAQLALALGVRSEKRSLFQIGFFSNRSMAGAVLLTLVLQLIVIYTPFFQRIFKTTALTFRDLLITVMASLLMLVVVEGWKSVRSRKT